MNIQNFCYFKREFARTNTFQRWALAGTIILIISTARVYLFASQTRFPEYVSLNIWDCIFLIANHQNLIIFAYIPLFLLLISDVLFSTSLSQEYYYQIRLGNRFYWWRNKIVFALLHAAVYVMLLYLSPVLTAFLLQVPFSWEWSSYAAYVFEQSFILSHVPGNFSTYPPTFVVFLSVLLFALSIVILAVIFIQMALVLNNGYAGSLFAYGLVLLNYVVFQNSPLSLFNYLIINNLYLDSRYASAGDTFIVEAYTLLLLLLIFALYTGYSISNKKDFLSKEHTRL
ncbi:hypothetical protein [Paenibacillus turpanensis]|uniref:hypothetical protein n=1 Tax=Paenibacillus turpanensis TaxID=2689078 RepID=UPI001408DF7B|nr:hypothetical protein [Paenibacillus turpanensis]